MQTSDITTHIIPSFEQMQIGDSIAYFATVMSILAIVAAIHSAISAKKSAKEAARSRKIQEGEALSSNFEKIANALRRIRQGEKFKENDTIVLSTLEAIEALKGRLSNDPAMRATLEDLSSIFSKKHPYGTDLFVASVGYKTERFIKEHGQTLESFKAKKREYLSIG